MEGINHGNQSDPGRPGQLTAKQQTDALLFLAGYAPATFDAIAEAVEPCAGTDLTDVGVTSTPVRSTSRI
jgi:hypothetical protein